MKNQRGITLIALVVTIIVLLILAGVSIAMLTGDNGILTNSSKSAYETEKAEAIEKINMSLNSIKTSMLAKKVAASTYDPTDDVDNETAGSLTNQAEAELNDSTNYKVVASGNTITITYTNNNYKKSAKKYSTLATVKEDTSGNAKVEGSITLATSGDVPGGTITGAVEKP